MIFVWDQLRDAATVFVSLRLSFICFLVQNPLRHTATASVSRCLFFLWTLNKTGSNIQQLHLWAGVCPLSGCHPTPAQNAATASVSWRLSFALLFFQTDTEIRQPFMWASVCISDSLSDPFKIYSDCIPEPVLVFCMILFLNRLRDAATAFLSRF